MERARARRGRAVRPVLPRRRSSRAVLNQLYPALGPFKEHRPRRPRRRSSSPASRTSTTPGRSSPTCSGSTCRRRVSGRAGTGWACSAATSRAGPTVGGSRTTSSTSRSAPSPVRSSATEPPARGRRRRERPAEPVGVPVRARPAGRLRQHQGPSRLARRRADGARTGGRPNRIRRPARTTPRSRGRKGDDHDRSSATAGASSGSPRRESPLCRGRSRPRGPRPGRGAGLEPPGGPGDQRRPGGGQHGRLRVRRARTSRDTVTLMANYIPLEEPAGGPNFAKFGDDVLYALNVDNDGDAKRGRHVRVPLRDAGRGTRTRSSTTPARSRRSTDPDWNIRQTYTRHARRRPRTGEVLGCGTCRRRRSTSARARRRTTASLAAAAVTDAPGRRSRSSPASATTRSSSTSARCSTSPGCGRSTRSTCIPLAGRRPASTASAATTRTRSRSRCRSDAA